MNMKQFWGMLLIPLMATVSACRIDVDDDGYVHIDYHYYSDEDRPYEDRLIVIEAGEELQLEFNELSLTAAFNWQDGRYYFTPDPEGRLSGSRIICVVTYDDDDFAGSCYRQEHVCQFRFTDTWEDHEAGYVFRLSRSSCRYNVLVGPFLVPLDAPLCGEDPFPACPDEELIPDSALGTEDDSAGHEKESAPSFSNEDSEINDDCEALSDDLGLENAHSDESEL